MKKLFLSLFVFAASGAYIVYQYAGGSPVSASVAQNLPQTTAQTIAANVPTSSTNTQTPPVQTSPTPAPVKPKGQYTDGTYTGSAADAYYGYVQVKATIQGGKLVDVTFLQYPNDRNTSRYINSQAMPLLKSEAIAAQSASVSGVSGASDTSMAFRESLGGALAQAKA